MTVITNAILICPEGPIKAGLSIKDGKIHEIGNNISREDAKEIIDASGCYVFPGFIDAHTHLDMNNGVTNTADDFYSGTRAAIAGGTTTIIDYATQEKGGSLKDALKEWHKKADGNSSCNYGFHMAICDWNNSVRSEMEEVTALGVSSFKLYMAYDSLMLNDGQILDVLKTVRELKAMLGVHCENGSLINYLGRVLLERGIKGPEGHPLSRPAQAEAEAVNRLLYISKLAGWPVNIVHLSSAAALEEVRRARHGGQTVYVESCPQYLLLDESRYLLPDFEGAKYVISPPLRSIADRDILQGALENGEIDTIATDHCSFSFAKQKSLGINDFTKIPNGSPGLEHRPALIYSNFVENGRLSPMEMCRLLSENPAKLFGMFPEKGVLARGSDADIVIWRAGINYTITAEDQYSNCDYNPYEGMEVCGRPYMVILGGETVVKNGRLIKEKKGRYVHRKHFCQY